MNLEMFLRAVDAIVLCRSGQVDIFGLIQQADSILELQIQMNLIVILGLSLSLVDLVQVRSLLVTVLLGFLL